MMKNAPDIFPPRWATRLLSWYCKPALLEDLEGDLNEYFQRNVQAKGVTRARMIYILDALKFFRPYTVRKPEFLNLLIHYVMIGSYIRTSGRSIVRNKLFSAINIIGLAISMSVGLLIIAMLMDLFAYDNFHENGDRIYRVIGKYEFSGKSDFGFMATTSLKAARAIEESFTGIDDVAILHRDFSGDVTFGEQAIPLRGFWANEGLFRVFSFRLLQGDPVTALKAPFSVVLTEKSALKIFGEVDVLGKTVILHRGEGPEQNREYTITGVMKDLPVFSHMKFDMLGSLSTRQVTAAEDKREMAWDNMWNTWTYLLLQDEAAVAGIRENFVNLSAKEDKTVPHTHIELGLQPLKDIMTGEDLGNPIGTTMGSKVVNIFGILSFIVVLSACLNYTNLSIARSFRRSREVGIRKAIGALRSHVINQFIIESVIIALMALVFSFGLFLLIKPHFLSLEKSLQELLVLDLSPMMVVAFIFFAILVGVLAGIFPALFFARINAVQVLKNLSAIPVLKGVTMRKVMIVFQYCISIIAITATLIIHQQYKHFIAYDLGFTTENILNIELKGNKAELVKKGLEELPEVRGISQSSLIVSIGNYWGTMMRNPHDPQDSAAVSYNLIDENYLTIHDHKLLAGTNFKSRAGKVVESEVIVNEEVIKSFNIGDRDPAKAIGQVVRIDGKNMTIIGVMRDFNYGRANDRVQEGKKAIMRYGPDHAQYLNVKILSTDWPETYSKIENIWKKIDPVHALEAKFYTQQIEDAFQGMKASLKVGSFLAILIICIASIGLLGMVVYSTETRLREVSIRKVFGAGEMRLLLILSKGFLVLLFIASAIGLPVTWLFFDMVFLREVGNPAPIGFFEMCVGVLAVMGLALLMIGTQTLKVARTNPADVLRGE
ncbi:MAG: ABC transporter permease [Cyclobacteriaceae bacterium]